MSKTCDFWSSCANDPVWAARLENQDPLRLPLRDFDRRARLNHPVIDFSTSGSQSVALVNIVSEAGRQRVLTRTDARVVTRGTAINQLALWRTCFSFAHGVWKILPTFLVAYYNTPDNSRAVVGTPSLSAPPADVEITIKRYVRACKRGTAKHHFNFEEFFPLPLFWTDTSKSGVPHCASGHHPLEWVVGREIIAH